MLYFGCDICKEELEAPESLAGGRIKCPKCKQRVNVPQLQVPVAPGPTEVLPQRANHIPSPMTIAIAASVLSWSGAGLFFYVKGALLGLVLAGMGFAIALYALDQAVRTSRAGAWLAALAICLSMFTIAPFLWASMVMNAISTFRQDSHRSGFDALTNAVAEVGDSAGTRSLESRRDAKSTSTSATPPTTPPLPSVGETLRAGNLSVRLDSIEMRPVVFKGGRMERLFATTSDPVVLVNVTIQNVSKAKRAERGSLGASRLSFDDIGQPKLRDEHGNIYRLYLGGLDEVDGVNTFNKIDPGQSFRDAVAFETPVPQAQTFEIELVVEGQKLRWQFSLAQIKDVTKK